MSECNFTDCKAEFKELNAGIAELNKQTALQNQLLAQYNKSLEEHMKRTSILEDRQDITSTWVTKHQTASESKWQLIMNFSVIIGILATLFKLFGIL